MLCVLFQICEYKSRRKNDYDCAAICCVYRTLTELPDSKDRTVVPLVFRRELVKPAMTLLSTVTTATVTNESVFFLYLIAVLQIAPRQSGGGKWCSGAGSRVKGGGRMAGRVDIFNLKKYCVS